MTSDLFQTSSEVRRDLSPEWLELSSQVRKLAAEAGSAGTPLAQSAVRLCGHVERLHSDVEQLLAKLNASPALNAGTPLETLPPAPPAKIDEANLQIQREMHQKSDLQHIIKALFMWKDDPVERVRERPD